MTINRRALIASFGLGLTAAPFAALPARAQATALGGVRVDTGPIAARGLPNYAARVAAIGAPAARRALADRIGGGKGAPSLVLSLSLVQLASDPGGSRDRFFGRDRPLDWIEGDAILVDGRGREIRRKRFHTTNDAGSVERISTPYGEDLRIARLVDIFARWSVSELGL